MLAVTKSVVVNFDEPDALIASPYPTAGRITLFEVNSAVAPAKGRPVYFVFQPATLLPTGVAVSGQQACNL